MRVSQAFGGTNVPDVPSSMFHMPSGFRMRYDLANAAIARLVSGYAVYICDGREPMTNWFLPSPAMITVLLDAGPVTATFRHGRCAVPPVALWGPVGHAYSLETHGGISVGIGLTSAGWAALSSRSADDYRDRVVPLGSIVGADTEASLVQLLQSLGHDSMIAPSLDAFLEPILGRRCADQTRLSVLDELVAARRALSVSDLASAVGVSPSSLRRLCRMSLGMPPKTLLSRARFVRSFASWILSGEHPSYEGMDRSYFDVPHFLLDAKQFLGTTPRRFAARETLYLRASLRARLTVLGYAAHALHGKSPSTIPSDISEEMALSS